MSHALKQDAFSLIELLIILVLLGIGLSWATPALKQLLQQNQDKAVQQLLLSHLHQARMQAIIHQKTHTLCGSSDGLSCDGHWDKHWIILKGDSSYPNRVHQVNTHNKLCWRGLTNSIRFQPNGTAPASNGSFTLCRQQHIAWRLVLNNQGRIRSSDEPPSTNCCL